MFTFAILALFFCISCICLFDREKTYAVRYAYIGIGVFLFCFSAFKPIGIDQDSPNYVDYYYGINNEVLSDSMEFTFKWFIALAHTFWADPRGVFVLYALLAVPLRAYAIVKNTDLWLLSVLVWMSNYYLLQDMTQIRVAVAAGKFLIGIWFLGRGRRREYLLMALLATCFHYSAVILFFLVFFGNKPLSRTWVYALGIIPAVGYIIYFLGIDPFAMLPIPFLQDKIDIYLEMRDKGLIGNAINVFNIVFFLKFTVFYVMLWKHKLIEPRVPAFPLMMKLFALSTFCFSAFAMLPVMSFRLSELIGVVEILLIPCLAYTVRPLDYGKIIVMLYAFGCFALNVFYNQLIKVV